MATVQRVARRYLECGLSVVPIRSDGSKVPAIPQWKGYQNRRMSADEVWQHFPEGVGVAVVCGAISGHLEVIDFDDGSLLAPWGELVEAEAPGLFNRLVQVRTPDAGFHLYYRSPDGINGNQKLAEKPDGANERGQPRFRTLIETRGEGGYALAPGCPPGCHPTGRTYEPLRGRSDCIPQISGAERKILLQAARAFNKRPGGVVDQPAREKITPRETGLRPGDDYETRTEWRAVLEPAGWTAVRTQGEVTFWRRPGKDDPGISATTGYCEGDDGRGFFYCFSSNGHPFENGRAYSKFAAYALLHHAGDFSAAARALRAQGYGDVQPPKGAAKEGGEDADGASPYREQGGCLGFMKKLGRGDDATEIFSPLCNFVARVVEERALDDGLEVKRRFLVEGRLADGTPLSQVEISASQFAGMRWVTELWGVRARISAGMGGSDRLREALQVFSQQATSRFAYTHTGWRKIGGTWRYLHAGMTDPEVLLEPPLNRYTLPVAPEDVAGGLKESLALLDVAPDTVTLPLLAAVYLAPLCEFLHPDFVLFLLGKTGSLKSSLAALFLSHFGAFDRTSLPASWESTDNALERRLFTLKDTLCVVDDYAPRADAHAQRQQAQRAQRIIRAMGNLSGRSRLRADLSQRPEYTPRGLMISTGEDLPPGQSILARILSIEVERDRLNLERLTQAQQHADRLPHALAGYIDWLTPQLDKLAQELPAQWRQHRAHFTQQSAHLRIPEILAYLALGIDLFTSFAGDLGVISEAEIHELAKRTQAALLNLGKVHGQRVREEDPAEVFLGTLAGMLAQGRAYMENKNAVGEAGNREIIGWKDEEFAYLIPDAVRHAVGQYLRESGGHFPYSARTLNKALSDRGALVSGEDGRVTRVIKIGTKSQRVLQIPLALLEPVEEGAE